jgi:hypothetical protein
MIASVAAFLARPRLCPHGSPEPSRRYERRRPEKPPLYKKCLREPRSWLESRGNSEQPVRGYGEDDLSGYLEYSILCFGFGRALCTGCGQGFVVAFSCKGQGVCPSYNGTHMAQTSTHLVDQVIRPVRIRQARPLTPKRREPPVRGSAASPSCNGLARRSTAICIFGP